MARKLDFNKPIFVIEHCVKFPDAAWHTRINEDKYHQYASSLAEAIKEHVPTATILFNQVPKQWHSQDIYCQLIPNDDPNNDVYDMVPRYWSFEVSTVRQNEAVLLYSKMLANMWPLCTALGKKIGSFEDSIKQADKDKFSMKLKEYQFDATSCLRQPRPHSTLTGARTGLTSSNFGASFARETEVSAPTQDKKQSTANAEEPKQKPAAQEEKQQPAAKAEPEPAAPVEAAKAEVEAPKAEVEAPKEEVKAQAEAPKEEAEAPKEEAKPAEPEAPAEEVKEEVKPPAEEKKPEENAAQEAAATGD